MSNTVTPKIESGWKSVLMPQFDAPYFSLLKRTLIREYDEKVVYPPKSKLFSAFDHTPFQKVKVVILGQDPYHGPGQAHGLCFSVPKSIPQPPSLKNIFKEIHNDLALPLPDHGDLTQWANQGVFLLNTFLSVVEGSPLSHSKLGWERFTDASIKALSDHREGLIFLLWGSNARKKKELIDLNKHHVLESVHPSPLSAHRGFLGCKHFSKTNQLLQSMEKAPIDWQIK
jgi:uracil-DNA glycosylase